VSNDIQLGKFLWPNDYLSSSKTCSDFSKDG